MTEKQVLGLKPAPRLERSVNISTKNIPSAWTIENIDPNDAMILTYEANPNRIEFSERTIGIEIDQSGGFDCCFVFNVVTEQLRCTSRRRKRA